MERSMELEEILNEGNLRRIEARSAAKELGKNRDRRTWLLGVSKGVESDKT
jgi:hypothetical protein